VSGQETRVQCKAFGGFNLLFFLEKQRSRSFKRGLNLLRVLLPMPSLGPPGQVIAETGTAQGFAAVHPGSNEPHACEPRRYRIHPRITGFVEER